MKKSKKKHIKFILTIIGLTVFLLVVMLIFYLYYPTKPDFKITKEECHNETLSSKGNYGDLTMMDYDVCNQVEVDKIRTDCRINCNDEGFKDTTNCEMKDGCELLYQPVLKKGLSISWLDKNCECIDEYAINCSADIFRTESLREQCEILNKLRIESCQKYSCYSYQVEVLK